MAIGNGSGPISQPWGISVFGRGDVNAEPDCAFLRLAINRRANKADEAMAHARESAGLLRTTARRLGISDDGVSSSRIRLNSVWSSPKDGRKFLGYDSGVAFSIRISDLSIVDQALVELIDAGADQVQGITYDATNKAELRAQARRTAVDAARAKAELYADAASVGLGPVLHIEDVDPERLHSGPVRAGGANAGSNSDLAPGQITVSAAVVLGFALAH